MSIITTKTKAALAAKGAQSVAKGPQLLRTGAARCEAGRKDRDEGQHGGEQREKIRQLAS